MGTGRLGAGGPPLTHWRRAGPGRRGSVKVGGGGRGDRGAGVGVRESGRAGTGARGSGRGGWAGFLLNSGGHGGSAPPAAASAAAVAAAPGRLLLLLLHRGPLRPAAPGFLLPASGNCEKKKKKAPPSPAPGSRGPATRSPLLLAAAELLRLRLPGTRGCRGGGVARGRGSGRGLRGAGRPCGGARASPPHRPLGRNPAPCEADPHPRWLS